VFYDPLVACW